MIKPKPTQSESPFGFDELFFSTTDERGVIRFGNDVFIRVSGYPKEVLKGAPHSIIRHPDMPRAVFKLLWDTLHAGSPIAAYVKNMSANGNYYWVFAFVFPIEDGYISIRQKPSTALFQAAQALYPLALEVEEKEGMEGSIPFLLDQIKKSGFSSYTDFMIQAAFAELNAFQEKGKGYIHAETKGALKEITEISFEASEELKDCFLRIQEFQKSNQAFSATMEELTKGFQHLKFIALNMTVAAAKFGDLASSLGVIAKEFSDLSEQIRSHLSGLGDFVELLANVIQKCALKIVALDSQMLMVDFFIKESIQKIKTSQNAFGDMIENRTHFSRLFRSYAKDLEQEVSGLEKDLQGVLSQMEEVKKFTTGLEVIRQIGAVESARVNEVRQVFVHYLEEMQKFISLLQASNTNIHREVEKLQNDCGVIKNSAASMAGFVDTIFDLASKYSNNEIPAELRSP